MAREAAVTPESSVTPETFRCAGKPRPTVPLDTAMPEPKQPDATPAEDVIEISALAGGLAHEIRNSLSTLRMNLQLLEEDWRALESADDCRAAEQPAAYSLQPPPAPPSGSPTARDVARRSRLRLHALLEETRRLERILEDFLEFVRNRELRTMRCDLNELVSELGDFYRPQAEAHRIELDIIPARQPVYSQVDAALLKQALLNLVLNGQQAMPDGGRLTLRVEIQDDAWGRIEVGDSGPGISAANLSRIFDAYYSTRKGGTGLGLPMARRIARAHGGAIDVRSLPGEGTTSTIVLPLARDKS